MCMLHDGVLSLVPSDTGHANTNIQHENMDQNIPWLLVQTDNYPPHE